jgi:hypothetical protein
MKHLSALIASLTTLPALAHEGHGLFGSHWHATDALGFIGVAGLVVFAIWMFRK